MVTILMMSAKIATLGLLKIKVSSIVIEVSSTLFLFLSVKEQLKKHTFPTNLIRTSLYSSHSP